jgi:Spy/CpxP family protein refolding chaperone
MLKNILRFAMATALFSAGMLPAQESAPPSSSNPPSSAQPAHPGRTGQEPCWKQAGIGQSVMEQRHTIERDTHSQIEGVCENSALTPRQKQQQVREIRQQAQQKLDALVTPEQLSTLHSCQQQRAANHPVNEGHHAQGAGPCGNFASSQGQQSPSNDNAGNANPHSPADAPQN